MMIIHEVGHLYFIYQCLRIIKDNVYASFNAGSLCFIAISLCSEYIRYIL